VLEGERRQVGEMLKAMKSGPSGSVVLGMELSEIEAKGYNDFEIKY
jgi:acylphosphatase